MKVQNITTQPKFQPVTLQITIESEEEFDLLKTLFATNVSIPQMLHDESYINGKQKDALRVLMGDTHEALCNSL